jgi:hypothetical protein
MKTKTGRIILTIPPILIKRGIYAKVPNKVNIKREIILLLSPVISYVINILYSAREMIMDKVDKMLLKKLI